MDFEDLDHYSYGEDEEEEDRPDDGDHEQDDDRDKRDELNTTPRGRGRGRITVGKPEVEKGRDAIAARAKARASSRDLPESAKRRQEFKKELRDARQRSQSPGGFRLDLPLRPLLLVDPRVCAFATRNSLARPSQSSQVSV